MTVFVVNEITDDISAAEQWGPIRYVNHRYINGDELDDKNRIPQEFEQNMLNAAQQFNPDADYLLIVGDHLQIVAFSVILAGEKPHFNVLRWDRREKAYYPVRIETAILA